MALNFPNSPSEGQLFTPSGGPGFIFHNGTWLSNMGGSPLITSSAAQTIAENAVFSTTLTASETVTWVKSGGADASLFSLSGAVLSMTAKDFEIPVDADHNNIYVVQVMAIDGIGNTATQVINVTVTDVAEGAVTFSITDTVSDPADITANPYAMSGKSIGAADPARVVLLAVSYTQSHSGLTTPIATCDGVEMMLAAMSPRAQFKTSTQIFAIAKPTGTTANFALTFRTGDANPNVNRINAFVVRALNMSLVPSDFTGTGNQTAGTGSFTHTLDAKADNNGMVLALSGNDSTATPTETWNGVVLDQTLSTETLRTQLAHYLPVAAETSRPISFVVNGGGSVTVNSSAACCLAMAPAATTRKLIWDTFDRTNAGLDTAGGKVVSGFSNAGDWVSGGSTPYVVINANRLDNSNSAGAGALHSFDVGSTDMWVEWDNEVMTTNTGPFTALRVIDNDSFVGVRFGDGTISSVSVYRRQAGAMNSLYQTEWNATAGCLCRLEAEGTALRIYRNAELMQTLTLAAPFLTPTKAGIIGRSVTYTGFLARFRCGAL